MIEVGQYSEFPLSAIRVRYSESKAESYIPFLICNKLIYILTRDCVAFRCLWCRIRVLPMTTYDKVHRQCRTLENIFDSKLTTYAQLAVTIAQPNQDVEATGSSNRWKDLEQELEDLLSEVLFPQVSFDNHYLRQLLVRGSQRATVDLGK